MKKKLGVPDGRPLADFLPTITIKAKDLATEMTNFNVTKNDLRGEDSITDEHVQNNSEVRGVLTGRGIYPEELPPEEDIKKLERRVKAQDRKGIGSGKSLGKPKGTSNDKWRDDPLHDRGWPGEHSASGREWLGPAESGWARRIKVCPRSRY